MQDVGEYSTFPIVPFEIFGRRPHKIRITRATKLEMGLEIYDPLEMLFIALILLTASTVYSTVYSAVYNKSSTYSQHHAMIHSL